MGDALTEGCNQQTKYKGRVTQSTILLANCPYTEAPLFK